jgi:MoaA/NifB/PqqE/SkfB family radical SAM enzyme
MPFREMHVLAAGTVPLCENLMFTQNEENFCLPNVREDSLDEIWNSGSLRSLRTCHRKQHGAEAKLCGSCCLE